MKKFLPLAKPVLDTKEEKAVIKAMRSGWITLGPKTAEFEKAFCKYLGCKYAVALSSATAALHLALQILKLKKNDEVIVPAFTFAATVNTILHAGGKPVLADINPDTFCLDPKSVLKKITKNTKAILPVHYGGYPPNLTELKKIAKKHQLILIEDAATAIGTIYKGKKIGNAKHAVCFSFHPIKNITTGDGGMVTTNDPKIAKKINLLRLHGMSKEAWKRLEKTGSWFYQIVDLGFKYNMTDIAAAMGLIQLKKLDGFITKRAKIANWYKKLLKNEGIRFQKLEKNVTSSHNLFPILLDKKYIKIRNKIIEDLKKANIGANVYYIPLNYHPFYQKNLGWKKGDAPVTESIYNRLINLPMYPTLTYKDIKYICQKLIKSIKSRT